MCKCSFFSFHVAHFPYVPTDADRLLSSETAFKLLSFIKTAVIALLSMENAMPKFSPNPGYDAICEKCVRWAKGISCRVKSDFGSPPVFGDKVANQPFFESPIL